MLSAKGEVRRLMLRCGVRLLGVREGIDMGATLASILVRECLSELTACFQNQKGNRRNLES